MYPVFQQDTEEQPLGGANTIRKAWSGAAPSRVYAFQPAAAIRCTNVLTKCNIVVYPFCVVVTAIPPDAEGNEGDSFPMWAILLIVFSALILLVVIPAALYHKRNKNVKIDLTEPLMEEGQNGVATKEVSSCCWPYDPETARRFAATSGARSSAVRR